MPKKKTTKPQTIEVPVITDGTTAGNKPKPQLETYDAAARRELKASVAGAVAGGIFAAGGSAVAKDAESIADIATVTAEAILKRCGF